MFSCHQNPCFSNPCLHDSICRNGYTDKQYLCECQAGYTGEQCENGKATLALSNILELPKLKQNLLKTLLFDTPNL